jgi:beta-galactosidase GanA
MSTRSRCPIYWEQFEPRPGQFDYTTIDTVLTQARQHHVRLVLLWFGTWKNGSQHYMPEWMKLDPEPLPAPGGQERAGGGLAFAVRGRLA